MAAAAPGKGRKRKRAAKEKENGCGESPRRDLAAKKSHVRELAMAGRWQEIKRRYGSKMMDKAKAYAEKQRAKHTPQSLARDILLKNGYIAPDAKDQRDRSTDQTSATIALARAEVDGARCIDENNQRESSGLPAPPARQRSPQLARVSVSPETLTKDQLQLIERRRREALERRRRRDAPVACAAASSVQQQAQVHQVAPDVLAPAHVHQAPNALQSDVGVGSDLHCAGAVSESVGSYLTGATLATGLTIAGHYIHELDDACSHLVPDASSQEAQMIKIPASVVMEASRRGESLAREATTEAHHQTVQAPAPVSISQELAAAADIVMWEQEHEALENSANQPPVSVISVSEDDDDADLPRFKLLPSPEETIQLPPPADTRQAASWAGTASVVYDSPASVGTVDVQQRPIAPSRPTSNRKRTWQGQPSHAAVAAAQRPKRSNNHTATSHDASAKQAATTSDGLSNQHVAGAENRDTLEENAVERLIEKHLLDDALDTTLLQFIDMILS